MDKKQETDEKNVNNMIPVEIDQINPPEPKENSNPDN